ncbi:MAG: AI-2E family transporter [Armatimonadetes bacterium]|nr:AI-2E family transporter [Armatimonadota bacterium]
MDGSGGHGTPLTQKVRAEEARLERVATWLVVLVAVAYLLVRLRFFLATIALSAMLAYLLMPLVTLISRVQVARGRPVPHAAAVTISVLGFIGVVVLIGVGVGQPVVAETTRLVASLPRYQQQLAELIDTVRGEYLANLDPSIQAQIESVVSQGGSLVMMGVQRLVRLTVEWLRHTVEIILIPVLAFYFLMEPTRLRDELVHFIPARHRAGTLALAHRGGGIVASYVRAQVILMVIAWIIVTAGLGLLHMRFALTLGLFAGLTRAIPIIGPILGGIPIVLLALTESPHLALLVLAFFSLMHFVESKIILPKVMGKELEMHPALVVFALLLGNEIFGLLGMFLAVPVVALIRDAIHLRAEDARLEPAEITSPQ